MNYIREKYPELVSFWTCHFYDEDDIGIENVKKYIESTRQDRIKKAVQELECLLEESDTHKVREVVEQLMNRDFESESQVREWLVRILYLLKESLK